MLFISDNKKIDLIIKKLQPKLKLKINIERDFDCGLNDVFEKRPDVVFIQNQIAGVTGVSVARHIQLLLGETAPKFILIHDSDAKAKPIKGLYEYLIDLSQDEETVTADILEKLNLLLGQQWQYIFATSVFDGADYEAFTPAPEPPREPVSSFLFDVVPGKEPLVPFTTPTVPPLLAMPEIAVEEAFDFISSTDDQRTGILFEECRELDNEKTTAAEANDTAGEIYPSPDAKIPLLNVEQYAALPDLAKPADVSGTIGAEKTELTRPDIVKAVVGAEKTQISKPAVVKSSVTVEQAASPVHHSPPPLKDVLTEQIKDFPAAAASAVADKVQAAPSPLADCGGVVEEVQLVVAQEEREWIFDGEPSLKKSTWKWYQVVEVLLVLTLLAGGWYLIKQKSPSSPSSAMEAIQPAAPAPVSGGQKSISAAPPGTINLPSFIPLLGLEPSYAAQNPGWDRYVGSECEFRVFCVNGRLKALQVMAAKGQSISESQLKSMLVELTGSGEYRVTSREEKQGFQVSHAVVNGKAELLVYSKNSAVHAVVVSLD